MKIKLFDNLLLKILSLIAAIVLWLIVVNIDDAVGSRVFRNVPVTLINTDVITDQDQTYRIEEGTDVVDLTVYARRSVLNNLQVSDFTATADLQKDLRYDSMVKIEVSYAGNSSLIDRIEQSRENILLSIEELVTEQFKVSVKTKGTLSEGMVVGSAVPQQTLLNISGPASVVERVKRVEAEVDITGITGTTVRSCSLKLMNSDGDAIDGTYLSYIGKDSDFNVTITMLNTKTVGISFDVSDISPDGYGLGSITYRPETVVIAGTSADLRGIANISVPAGVLNPDKGIGQIERTVDISQYLPVNITIPNEDEKEIVVTMNIVPYVTANYSLSPDLFRYDNIREGLTLDVSESGPLEVPVDGLEAELAELTAENIQVNVDLTSYTRPGTYTVPVTVTVPDGFRVSQRVMMTLTLAGEEE